MMALNTLRDALSQTGLRAFNNESPFKSESDAALSGFQALRSDLERQVRRGELTVKVARERASTAASQLRESLVKKSQNYSAVSRAFADRLVEASNARRKARENLSMEGIQRETNKLLRQSLTEQQLIARAAEFEGRAFIRPISGGPALPTLEGLIQFHESETLVGDEAAVEWARRHLEAMRVRVINPEDRRRIDLACDRPDQVNPRLVAAYVEAMDPGDGAAMEAFVGQALESRDANACTAAFLMARQQDEATSAHWVRSVLNGLSAFPDAALATLRAWEAETRQGEAVAARTHAEFAGALAEAEARFPDLEPPSNAELRQQDRLMAKPVAGWDEPIGLSVNRRGLTEEEFKNLESAPPE
jgi:hypothetical protein